MRMEKKVETAMCGLGLRVWLQGFRVWGLGPTPGPTQSQGRSRPVTCCRSIGNGLMTEKTS